MEIFIGIDQSINSTGITIQKYQDNKLIKENFYIIHKDKFTKKEKEAEDTLNNFNYIGYNKLEKADAKDSNEFELYKLLNNIEIVNKIFELVKNNIESSLDKIYVGMEGVSYSSSVTQSIIDLAGLSYLIRYRFYKFLESNQDHKGNLFVMSPKEIKKFASGNGNANKDIMVKLFSSLYPQLNIIPKIDDISDSYWICCYTRKLANE